MRGRAVQILGGRKQRGRANLIFVNNIDINFFGEENVG